MKWTHRSLLRVIAVIIVGAGAVAWWYPATSGTDERVEILVPKFSETALAGHQAYNANCARCHGENGIGTEQGPPLVHDIYNPGHHGDVSFFRAVRLGVRQHHWPYGDMQALPTIGEQEIENIVRYIRELQEANGIKYRKHHM